MKYGIKNTAAMNKKAQEQLDGFGLSKIRATAPIENYNFEERKIIEILKSTWFDPKILVVDETTTALSQDGREKLFEVMRDVRAKGHCVISSRTTWPRSCACPTASPSCATVTTSPPSTPRTWTRTS